MICDRNQVRSALVAAAQIRAVAGGAVHTEERAGRGRLPRVAWRALLLRKSSRVDRRPRAGSAALRAGAAPLLRCAGGGSCESSGALPCTPVHNIRQRAAAIHAVSCSQMINEIVIIRHAVVRDATLANWRSWRGLRAPWSKSPFAAAGADAGSRFGDRGVRIGTISTAIAACGPEREATLRYVVESASSHRTDERPARVLPARLRVHAAVAAGRRGPAATPEQQAADRESPSG